jgi:hypothetical protein
MPQLKEIGMNDLTDLVDRYIAMWNETDPARRRDLIARTFTKTASYVDPVLQGDGPTGIDAMVQAVQQRYPGYRFRRTSDVDAHHGRVRFSWSLAPEGGPVFVDGIDVGVVAENRLQAITGFFDHAPAAQQQ